MGLAIDGNVVHGIAKGGQAFVDLANASFNITMLDYEEDESSDSGVRATFTKSDTGLNDFSEYSFYQILVRNIEGLRQGMTPLFSIKPNVQMPISVSETNSGSYAGITGSLILNVLADSTTTGISVSSNIDRDGFEIYFDLYGYKIN